MKNSLLAKTLLVAAMAAVSSLSASAALVTWDFNPGNLNQPTGSPTQSYTSSGYTIIATGYDRNLNGPDAFHMLQFKNEPPHDGATERGLGLFNTNANELNINPDGSVPHYIQLDLRSIFSLGSLFSVSNGQISIGSMQNGEGFRLFGPNVQGALGTQLAGTWSGLAFDNKFVAVPDFGTFQFLSIAAASGRILPIAFQVEITPIPEMSTVLPIVGLLTLVFVTGFRRRTASAR